MNSNLKKVADAIGDRVAEEASQGVKAGLRRLTLMDRLLVLGLALIAISAIFAYRDAKKDRTQKGPRKTS